MDFVAIFKMYISAEFEPQAKLNLPDPESLMPHDRLHCHSVVGQFCDDGRTIWIIVFGCIKYDALQEVTCGLFF